MALYNLTTKPSDFASKLIYMDGKPLYLLPYMRTIIDTDVEKLMLMTGRQVGKSTTVSSLAVTELTSHPYWRSLYVAPRQDQITALTR